MFSRSIFIRGSVDGKLSRKVPDTSVSRLLEQLLFGERAAIPTNDRNDRSGRGEEVRVREGPPWWPAGVMSGVMSADSAGVMSGVMSADSADPSSADNIALSS